MALRTGAVTLALNRIRFPRRRREDTTRAPFPATTAAPAPVNVPPPTAFIAPYGVSELGPITLAQAGRHEHADVIVLTTDDTTTVRTWRRATTAAIVAITSARTTATERAALMDSGADLCLTDPTANELAAHLRALQRRLALEPFTDIAP